jgi:hypothetical protein
MRLISERENKSLVPDKLDTMEAGVQEVQLLGVYKETVVSFHIRTH